MKLGRGRVHGLPPAAAPLRGYFRTPRAPGPADSPEFDRRVFRPLSTALVSENFRWKGLRHTVASRLRMHGVELATIRDLLGHTRRA